MFYAIGMTGEVNEQLGYRDTEQSGKAVEMPHRDPALLVDHHADHRLRDAERRRDYRSVNS
jgi:hypothetical protein